MADFNIAIEIILPLEGGLVDDPADPGGLTNFGIALTRHPDLTADFIRNMTREEAIEIYRKQYWTEFLSSVNDQRIANALFDIRVNEGSGTEFKILTQSIGTPFVDANHVLALTNSSDADKLLKEIAARRSVAYHLWISANPAREKMALGLFRRAQTS